MPNLIDSADLSIDVVYNPFNGDYETVYVDMNKSLKETLVEAQEAYNPMLGSLTIRVNAAFSHEEAKIIKNKDKFEVENFKALSHRADCNMNALIALDEACKISANWHEIEDGIECTAIEIEASVLKAHNPEFDIVVDTLFNADAVDEELALTVKKMLNVRAEAYKYSKRGKYLSEDSIGVLGITDIKCEDSVVTAQLCDWLLDNIKTILINYVATPIHVVMIDTDRAYTDLFDCVKAFLNTRFKSCLTQKEKFNYI